MPTAEGLELPFDGPEVVRADLLETIPYDGPIQRIELASDELSAVCPFSGLPDLASIEVEYYPSDRIVELKSFKYYLVSFRTVGIYQENLTARVAEDLEKLLEPRYLRVSLVYATRGGIDARTTVTSGFLPSV